MHFAGMCANVGDTKPGAADRVHQHIAILAERP